jgi:outer membrane lipoprotein-sorting protein
MKKTGQLFMLACLTILYCGCQSVQFSPEVDKIITKIRQKRDPQGKLASINSEVTTGEFRSNTTDKPIAMSLSFRKPDNMKVEIIIPGKAAFIKAYNGKKGWFFSTKKGLHELSGKSLDELRLQAMLLNPMPKLSDIFASIKLKGISHQVGEKCYKFVCKPKPEFKSQPITFYVSTKSYLILKREEIIDGENGKPVKVITVFNDYQPADGIMVARNIVSLRNGKLMEFNVKSVKWNKELNDSVFSVPEALK